MGGRLLRAWIQKPLMDRHRIEERQEIIQVFLDHFFERSDLADRLKGVYDIERLASRVSFGKTTPKDLLQLGETLRHVPLIKSLLVEMGESVLDLLVAQLDELPELCRLIEAAIDPDAPIVLTEGNIIRTGFDPTLDQYRVVLREGTGWIAETKPKNGKPVASPDLKLTTIKKMAIISM